jgi:PAS domain S-box-containing protein
MHDRAATQGSKGEGCAAIWLGDRGPLLDAALIQFDVYHVQNVSALFRAVQHGLASCVVIDLKRAGTEELLQTIRARWPGVGIVALADEPPVQVLEEHLADNTISNAGSVDDLRAMLTHLVELRGGRNDYVMLHDRARQLEGLIGGTLSSSGTVEFDAILGDLREAGRTVVDADDVAVLLSDGDYQDLTDALRLGVPASYLAVCREHFRERPFPHRLRYLGDEVLLRARLPDMPTGAARVREAEAAGAQSYMRIPITIDQQLAGFVALFAHTPNRFNGAHLQLGRLFAAHVATAIRNRDLYMRLNRAEQYQAAISEIARMLAEDLTLDDVLDHIVHEAAKLASGQAGAVLLVQTDGSLLISAVYDRPPQRLGERMERGVGQAGVIATTGQPSVVSDYRNWPQADPAHRDSFPPHTDLIGVPLMYRSRVLGVLQVMRSQDRAGTVEDALEALVMLAPHAAIAIAKAQLHETVVQDRRQLQVMLDHTPAAVVTCDADGVVQIVNPAAERLFGALNLAVDVVREHHVLDLLRRTDVEIGLLFEELEFPCAIEVAMGRLGEYMVHIAPIADTTGKISGYVSVAQDVTQMRRMDRMKSNLNRVLTHDLGNLLMLARNPLELIDEPDLRPDQRDQLKQMLIGSMARMEALLKDVMELDLLPSLDQRTVSPYRLEVLTRRAVEHNQDAAHRQRIALIYRELAPLPHALTGHEVLIMQAIDNLVSNAIKYTPDGGQVRVTLDHDDDFAVVQVTDNGYGIPVDKLERIFEPFVRVKDPRTTHVQGTGIGLNLVKTFIEAHGGHVKVESVIDRGSTFSIFLPLKPIQEIQDPTKTLTRIDLTPLVDGSPQRRQASRR